MFEVLQSTTYREWFAALEDAMARAVIDKRLRRLTMGHVGNVKSLKDGVSELKIDVGPGYRVYFTRRGQFVYLLLCGGDKRTQKTDIARAKRMVEELED